MKQLLHNLLKKPGYRYLLIGGTVYALELLIIVIAQHFGSSARWAVSLSFWSGFIISFGLQKLVTFGDTRLQRKIVISQFLAVGVLVVCNYGFTIFVTSALQPAVPAAISRTLALAVTTIWNFYLYKTRIFKPSQPLLTLE